MDFFDTAGSLALASRLKRLSDSLMAEVRIIYRSAGVDFEPRWFPLFFLLRQNQQVTVTDVANVLKVPHPYISQLIKEMRQAKLIVFRRHPEDGRSRILSLSPRGHALAREVEPLWGDIQEAINALIQQVDVDVLGLLRNMERLLIEKSLSQVVQNKRRLRAIESTVPIKPGLQNADYVHIRPIEQGDNAALADIIRSVMTEHGASGAGFSIHDSEVDHMYEAYTEPTSCYFVVVQGGHIVGGGGVAQLIGTDSTVCELRKMYFLPVARGLGAGRALLDLCLAAARRLGYAQCYLETLKSMQAAQRLYTRAGFASIPTSLGKTGHFSCDQFYIKDLV